MTYWDLDYEWDQRNRHRVTDGIPNPGKIMVLLQSEEHSSI